MDRNATLTPLSDRNAFHARATVRPKTRQRLLCLQHVVPAGPAPSSITQHEYDGPDALQVRF
jgi:hypothetical protein